MENEIIDTAYESLTKKLSDLLNSHSIENRSDTPDFMLAEFMLGCLTVYENTINNREKWFGRTEPFRRNLPTNPAPTAE